MHSIQIDTYALDTLMFEIEDARMLTDLSDFVFDTGIFPEIRLPEHRLIFNRLMIEYSFADISAEIIMFILSEDLVFNSIPVPPCLAVDENDALSDNLKQIISTISNALHRYGYMRRYKNGVPFVRDWPNDFGYACVISTFVLGDAAF